jgi:hypothetical protein
MERQGLAAEPVPHSASQREKQLASLLPSVSVEEATERMARVMVLERMTFMV